MRGVGRIYEQFRDGVLEDDDEVALVHGPVELGYAPITVPMVNVRATVTRGVREDVISTEAAVTLIDRAKSIFYQNRTWDVILEAVDVCGEELSRLQGWLPEHQVDQKREDAKEMLAVLQKSLGEFHQPCFSFESNIYWEQAASLVDREDSKSERLSELDVLVLDEARLRPKQWTQWCTAALGRFFAGHSIHPDPWTVERALKTVAVEFRAARGMARHSDLLSWCIANALDEGGLEKLLRSEECLRLARRATMSQLYPSVLAQLRSTGCYQTLADRGRAKQIRLKERGWSPPASQEVGASLTMLADELIEMSAETPEALAAALGFEAVADLNLALARELAYRSIENDQGGGGDD